ncbi:selenocysteine-specific translation elongation factor [Haliangium sp.]|uniref:selenocysteine-specific translation elongation factor n=1 Tax=Haliangium sp. TaxID=2663208 RepID=UPI003D142470
MQSQPIVLGTAGHIDHGKTALVKALTGIDTDRLKVEKERGITTELGFAYLDLDGRRYGVVDVPGHERFIKAMVSGAGGLDLVCLVIAADEGIMPQTREHLDVCELLGVRRGLVALSKADLVDDEWLALMAEEVREGLAQSFLAEAAIVPVSARTGAGLDALRSELVRLTRALPARDAGGAFRLPFDRVFTIRGFGTVVTGTILGGEIGLGDTVVVHPRGLEAKVRGIEVHGDACDRARAGMRCALNLSGVAREDLRRGDMLSVPGAVAPSHIIDARFRYLRTSKTPLGRRSRVLFHHATAQLMATLVLVDADQLSPGEEGLVQLRLDIDEPIAALPGDRFIARGFVLQDHYGTTIGGGEIVRVKAPKVRRSAEGAADTIRRMAEAAFDERVALEVKASSFAGTDEHELGRRLGHGRDPLRAAIERLAEAGEIVVAAGGGDAADVLCHAETFAGLEKQALDLLDGFHADNPHSDGMSRQELRSRLPSSLPARMYEAMLAALVRRGAVTVDADLVRRASRRSLRAPAPLSALEQTILDEFTRWGVTPERPKQVPAAVGVAPGEAKAAMDKLLKQGHLVKIKPDLYLEAKALDQLRQALERHLDQHQQITPAEWKSITGASRKFSIPLAEYFDAEKLTLRVGDIRKRRG